jgi:hypothetical protein
VKEKTGSGVFDDDLRAVSDGDGPVRAPSFKILSRSIRPPNRQFPNAIPRVFNQYQRARFKNHGTLRENCAEPLIYRGRSFVSEAEDDHARFVEHAECEYLAEVEIECEDDARIRTGALDDVEVWRSLHAERSDVHRFVTELD